MEPFEAAPARGYRLNRKVFAAEIHHLDDMPMYLRTHIDGVAYIYHCNDGETAESATDRLCDRLGGASLTEPSLSTDAGAKARKRGSHGTWISNVSFYGKVEQARTSSRTCAAPLVCPNMPVHLRTAPYAVPTDDAEDEILTAAIANAELERSPAYRAKQQTLSFFRAQAAMPCPYVRQDYRALGATAPKPCTGLMRLRPLHTGQWFVGCTAYNNEHGHRFVLVPPSVNMEMLQDLFDDPDKADARTEPPASCLYMESRWARHHTCPLEPELGVHLVPAGTTPDGSCPVRLTIYSFTKPALAGYAILLLTGEHTHPRGIRAIPRGHLRSRVFDMLQLDPTSTRAQLAKRIRDELQLRPNSAAIRHAWADHRLANNPLGEDQVGVMARLAASAGGPQYIRKVVFGARSHDNPDCPYSYVTFYLDAMMDVAGLQSSFCADMSFKDFAPIGAAPDGTNLQWHLFSLTIWSTRLHRTVTVFKAATLGESADLYRELFEEFLRECGLHGQTMPLVGTAVTERTVEGVRPRELVSLTVDFCAAQAHGAAIALAKKAGLANAVDAARAFLRGCSVHYQRAVQRLPLDRDNADKDLWTRLLSAPSTVATLADANQLLHDLQDHHHKRVRDWAAWASQNVIRHMLFPRVYSRMHADLLVAVPANTNSQESRHHANAAQSPPGQLLRVITHHERMDKQAMDEFYGRGSGGSEKHRPLNTERRYVRQAQRSHKSRANTNRHQGAADASMPTFAHEPDDAHEPTHPTLPNTPTTSLKTTPTATQSTVTTPSRVQHGGGEHRPGASKTTTPATPRLTPPPASSLLLPAKRTRSSAVPTDDDATRPSSPTAATEHPLPTDIRRLVAAVERQTAVAEQQLCVAARQQELLNALLAAHQPDKRPGTGTTQSHAASSPEHRDVADNKSTHSV